MQSYGFQSISSFLVFLYFFSNGAAAYGAVAPRDYEHIAREAAALGDRRDYAAAVTMLEEAAAHADQDQRPAWGASILGLLGSIYERRVTTKRRRKRSTNPSTSGRSLPGRTIQTWSGRWEIWVVSITKRPNSRGPKS
jgi:hypothetical protein